MEQLGRLPVYIWQPGDERIDRSGGYIFIWTIGLKNGQQYEILSANRAEYLLLPSGEKIEFLFALTRERDRIFAVDETK